MNFYVGTSGYSYPAWRGEFYPKNLPERQMLRFYGEHFQSVEINHTHYHMPTLVTVKSWAKDVGREFKFALKAPQRITHFRRLQNAGKLVAEFLEVAGTLAKRLGPLLFQLPPNFKKDVPRLRTFLESLPARRRVAFEFRHASCFDDEVFALLRRRRIALCIAETEEEKVPLVTTADWGYLRLRRADYSDARLRTWVSRIKKQRWRDVFVYFMHDDKGNAARLAKRFLELAK